MAENEVEPQVVQTAGYKYSDKVRSNDSKLTDSATSDKWANADDGRVGNEDEDRASRKAQRDAFIDYEARPDIESRASILAREHAAPGAYGSEDLEGGFVEAKPDLSVQGKGK